MKSGSGSYNQRYEIFTLDQAAFDSGNNPTNVPSSQGSRWGSLTPAGGAEFLGEGQIEAESTHMIKMRNDTVSRAITQKSYLELGTRTFEVVSAPMQGLVNAEEVMLQVKETL